MVFVACFVDFLVNARGKTNRRSAKKQAPKKGLRFESLEPRSLLSGTNLIIDGSFETPVVTTTEKWNVYDSLPGLTPGSSPSWNRDIPSNATAAQIAAYPKIEIQKGVSRPASDGSQYVELDGDMVGPGVPTPPNDHGSMGIYQVITTVTGQLYSLAFAFAGRPGSGHPNILGVSVIDTETHDHLINSSPTGSKGDDFDITKSPDDGWTNFTYLFTATGTSTKIAFEDRGVDNRKGTLLDKVSVVAAPITSVQFVPKTQLDPSFRRTRL